MALDPFGGRIAGGSAIRHVRIRPTVERGADEDEKGLATVARITKRRRADKKRNTRPGLIGKGRVRGR